MMKRYLRRYEAFFHKHMSDFLLDQWKQLRILELRGIFQFNRHGGSSGFPGPGSLILYGRQRPLSRIDHQSRLLLSCLGGSDRQHYEEN